MSNRAASRKKSNFVSSNVVPDGATFDYVYNGTNIKIPVSDLLVALGVTGTLVQQGGVTGTPVLNKVSTINYIRNILGNYGIKTSVSTEGDVKLDIALISDTSGVPVLTNLETATPLARSIIGGPGINVAATNGAIQIALSATPVSTKTEIVNSESDFPAAVGGVITLAADTQYFLTNDITTINKFTFSENSVLTGSDSALIKLEYTGVGTMVTINDTNNAIKNITLSAPTGAIFSITGPSLLTLFNFKNCRITSCATLGTVSDMAGVNFDEIAFEDIQSGGLSFSGTFGFFALIGSTVALNGGEFMDLGTALFEAFLMSQISVVAAAGTTVLSGEAASANLLPLGVGIVSDSIHTGAGAPLAGISSRDAQWSFKNTREVPDSKSQGLVINSGATYTITVVSTPVKLNNSWVSIDASRFTLAADGTFTYVGNGDFIAFTASISATVSTGTNIDCNFYFYKNGVQITNSKVLRRFNSGVVGNLSMVWSDELVKDDYIEIWAENISSTADVVISAVSLRFD